MAPLASRESTTSETQSTSSKTKMHSETATFTASPSAWYRSSKSQSASFWFVPTWDSLMLTTWRRVLLAMALINDVLPVPGGPQSSRPSLCGKPGISYLPALASKASREDSTRAFSLKKRESKVFSSESRYFFQEASESGMGVNM